MVPFDKTVQKSGSRASTSKLIRNLHSLLSAHLLCPTRFHSHLHLVTSIQLGIREVLIPYFVNTRVAGEAFLNSELENRTSLLLKSTKPPHFPSFLLFRLNTTTTNRRRRLVPQRLRWESGQRMGWNAAAAAAPHLNEAWMFQRHWQARRQAEWDFYYRTGSFPPHYYRL